MLRKKRERETSISGSPPNVAEKQSSGMRCIWNAEEAVRATRYMRVDTSVRAFCDQLGASFFVRLDGLRSIPPGKALTNKLRR